MEEYIRVEVVPEILKYYKKTDSKLDKYELRSLQGEINNFNSSLYDLNLSISGNDYSFVLKTILDDLERQKLSENRILFTNEAHLYNVVVPIFKKLLFQKNFKFVPDVPYAVIKDVRSKEKLNPLDGIIVVENLVKEGYKVVPGKNLDMEHCVVAVEQLGRWHALSLAIKELNSEQFHQEVLTGLEECTWSRKAGVQVRETITICMKRLFKYANYPTNSKTYEAMKTLEKENENLLQYVEKLIMSSRKSKLSVLCHGDYTQNNLLFKYDKNGTPISVIPVDYQQTRFASPAFDLSHFIYLNTSHEIREKYFLDLMKKYHASLVSTMSEILTHNKLSTDISTVLPSLDSILEDYRQYGAYGLIYGLFFVPWRMGTEEEFANINKAGQTGNRMGAEFSNAVWAIGGEAGTNAVLEIFDTAVALHRVNI
ncbi:uncharacterized protein LOC124411644 [Diprion similis]|uniref:uncharacterized protein LOC124411644 n=1 Tax=Diprion similis TaxID=362088 RepID=UPI001EF8B1F2|nr:uncharacterized protein LOC124411644 [Diprion similis]